MKRTVSIETFTAAAIDGEDWESAALAILANPFSAVLGRSFAEPLSRIALRGETENAQQIVERSQALIDELERVFSR